MALTVTCAKNGVFARCIGFKLRCVKSSVGSFSRDYATEKSKQKKNLPVPPKRPLTAYLDFYTSHLDEIRKNNKDIKHVKEMAKISSQMWKDLDGKTKKEYEAKYKKRKDAYDKELKKFNESLTEKEKKELKEAKIQKKEEKLARKKKREKLQKRREFNMPKRPVSGYGIFVKEKSSERPADVKMKDYMKTLAEQWGSLSDEEKKVFNDEAHSNKELYKEKMSAWVQLMVEEGNGEVVEKNLLKKELENLGQPKGPKSAFQLYLVDTHVSVKDNQWKSMTDEEKEPYVFEASGEKQRFKDEMDEWMQNMEALGKEDFVLEAAILFKGRSKKSTSKAEKHEISDSESDDDDD